MALCPSIVINSNDTELFIAEEECPGVLPATPEWRQQEPNSYSDFGGDVQTTERKTIHPSRQNQKGTAVSQEASGGFNQDVTKSNMTHIAQGFFHADAREPASTNPINGTKITISEVVSSGGFQYTHTTATSGFVVGDIVLRSGFDNLLNSDMGVVTAVTSTTIVIADGAVEASPPAEAKLEVVGVAFDTADVAISFVSNVLSLVSTVYDFSTNANLFPGQWIFLGGDGVSEKFVTNKGYARIKSISTDTLVLDEPTWSPLTEVGTGLDIKMFIPITVKNENTPSLIKRRTYQLERTLGKSADDTVQAEYLVGCAANGLTINIPTAEKINADLSFSAMRDEERSGLTGDLRKTGTRIEPVKENAINTSTDVYLMRLALTDESSLSVPLFGYMTSASLAINNNTSPHQAIGVLGAVENTAGSFDVTGSVTAYFTTMASKTAIRKLQDVSMNFIVSRDNTGTIYDIPLVTLSGGKITVEKDAPVTIPLDQKGCENQLGYTASYSEFPYLPELAMP